MSTKLSHNGDESTIQATQTQDMHTVERSPAGFEVQTLSSPPSHEASPSFGSKHASPQAAHHRFVFTDPVAFRYVADDFLHLSLP